MIEGVLPAVAACRMQYMSYGGHRCGAVQQVRRREPQRAARSVAVMPPRRSARCSAHEAPSPPLMQRPQRHHFTRAAAMI